MMLLFSTSELIAWGGVALITLLVFAETGLLMGLVLPGGETLIFTAGFLVSAETLSIRIIPFLLLLTLAAYVGDLLGYSFGKKLGPKVHRKKDSWYFKRSYLLAAQKYFQKNKKLSIIIGKFFPIIRPFVPLLCGISSLHRATFLVLSFLSVSIFISTFLLLGYFLGNSFPELKNYLHWILPISVIVLVVPVVMQLRKNRERSNA